MYYFITNLHGGSGKALKTWKKVEKLLAKKNVQYEQLVCERPGHAGELAAQISLKNEDDIRLIVVGGDGTINEVLNGIQNFENIKFGVIPTGSGNDFARGNGIPKKSPKKALEMILKSEGNNLIDIGKITIEGKEQRYFGISCGIGLDAIVCKKTDSSRLKKVLNKLHLGSMTYVILTVQTLFEMEKYDVTVKYDQQEPIHYKELIYLAAMNSPFEGGGVPMAPFAKTDDGELSFCGVDGAAKIKTFFMLPFLCAGNQKIFKDFKLGNFKRMEVSAEKPMVLHTDGEYAGDVQNFAVEVIPSKLNLLK